MCKLIVLDDDHIQHLIIKRMLNKYETFNDTMFSVDGRSILSFLEINKNDKNTLPELIFVDLNMPKLDGWGFLDNLKVLYPHLNKSIDVYVISSSIDPKDIKRSGKYPFVKSYLIKPVSNEALSPIVQNIH